MMNEYGKSDNSIVPKKLANKTRKRVAESMEERELAKGNSSKRNAPRTQGRIRAQSALERIRQAARKDRKAKFTALFHHITLESLHAAFLSTKRTAAAGVDDVTWEQYAQRLQSNLEDLHGRLQRVQTTMNKSKPQPLIWLNSDSGGWSSLSGA